MKRLRIFLVALLIGVMLLLALGPATASAADPGYPCGPRYHVVCRGETLTRIAWRYGTTVQAIAAANGIWNPNRIYAGQVLLIPCPPGPWHPGPRPTCHVVRWGETLFGIARMYGTSVWAIARANHICNINYIRAGQCLIIP